MTTNPLGMSDEDFLNQAGPPEEEGQSAEQKPAAEAQPQSESAPAAEPVNQESKEAPEAEGQAQPGEGEDKSPAPAEEKDVPSGSAESKPAAQEALNEAAPEASKEGEPKTEEKPNPEKGGDTPDYEAFYKQIMAPFKANGKTIELRDPAEAIQLMQMGANYTRKMQELAGHRKVLMMLENNGLLDEGKLSFLIDIDKKDPAAIAKLVKESGVDPLTIDTTAEPAYREGNHRVTDEDAAFHSALQDLQSSEGGQQTLRLIHADWDQASKEALWKAPELLGIMHAQREVGIYDRIVTEVNRQKVLGAIPPGTSFLQAYRAVGDKMQAANAFADLVQGSGTPNGQASAPGSAAAPEPVAVRVAAPKPAVVNSEKASAASPTRATPPKAKETPNFLSMSDEEFLKQMAERV